MKHLIFILSLICFAQFSISTAKAAELTTIKVNLYEMSFEIEGLQPGTPLVLKTGQKYKLIFENLGKVRHEVLMGRGLENEESDEYIENLLSGFKFAVSGAVMLNQEKRIWIVETTTLNEIEVDPGIRLAIYFTLPESSKGVWELGCFMPGHFQMGMKLPLIVE